MGDLTSIDKERAEFEAYALENTDYDLTQKANGDYEFQGVQDMWESWQASAARSSARIAELEAEVERLKADSERLSWLSRVDYDELSFSLHQDNPHDGKVQICYGDKLDGDYAFGEDFRSAIDEAMKGGA